MDNVTQDLLTRHDAFWQQLPQERPLIAYSMTDRFPYDKMQASRALMQHGLKITPEMVDVNAFADQTAELLAISQDRRLPRDYFQGVAPFGGIPWMECLLGCAVRAMEHSFVADPCLSSPGDPDALCLNTDGGWYQKYIEFLEVYDQRFGDTYPVTETLMRGCLDVYGSLIGQEDMIFALIDEPEAAHGMLDRINQIYVEMVKLTLRHSRRFHGGYLHPYGIWASGTVNQFQEDMSALITPQQMLDFVVPLHERMCRQFDFNGIHTHPTSYHLYPQQLSVKGLHLVQAQKDEGDPPIINQLPRIASIQQAGKCISYHGDLSFDELAALLDRLELRGLALTLMVRDEQEALATHEHILEICAKKRQLAGR